MNDQFSEMLSVLAHEMRTPIAAILGYQELLAEGIFGHVDPRGREPLARIAYSAKQLLNLIDGVHEVMSPPEKRLEVQSEIFEPGPKLRECIENATTDAQGRNVRLSNDVDLELPLVNADPDRFCRAIDLALSAAIKTSHGSTLHVGAQSSNGKLEIVIAGTALQTERDNPPISALKGGESSQLTGAGLRLAIVRHLASQMHGSLTLASEGGRTTLILEMPAYQAV